MKTCNAHFEHLRPSAGFTLIELMMTIAIAAILLTIGIPSFRDLIINNRIITQTNEVVSAINMARSEAIKRGRAVTVCASTDQATCSLDNNWATGWIVFVDTNIGGNPTVDTLLRVWPGLAADATLAETADSTDGFIRYQSNGTVGSDNIITHYVTGCSGDQQRTVTVKASGLVSTARSDCP